MIGLLLRLLGLLAVYCWWIEPSRLTITEHCLSDPSRPLANPVRVLLLTDWHLGRFSRPRSLRAKMRRLTQAHQRTPFDLVLLGGDYVDTSPRYLSRLVPILETLAQWRVPTFAVAGNHDYTSFGGDILPVFALLQAWGVTTLRGAAEAVTVGRQRLLVVGLDDLQEAPSYYSPDGYRTPAQYREAARTLDWYARFDSQEPDTPRLLLSHNPDAMYLPGRPPLAVLAGHTHGGQIILLDWVSRPLHRWIHPALPPGSAVTWAGRKTVEGRTLIVSRGMDGSALPLRLLRPPEAVVITFQ